MSALRAVVDLDLEQVQVTSIRSVVVHPVLL